MFTFLKSYCNWKYMFTTNSSEDKSLLWIFLCTLYIILNITQVLSRFWYSLSLRGGGQIIFGMKKFSFDTIISCIYDSTNLFSHPSLKLRNNKSLKSDSFSFDTLYFLIPTKRIIRSLELSSRKQIRSRSTFADKN